jgi:hypothetical protein
MERVYRDTIQRVSPKGEPHRSVGGTPMRPLARRLATLSIDAEGYGWLIVSFFSPRHQWCRKRGLRPGVAPKAGQKIWSSRLDHGIHPENRIRWTRPSADAVGVTAVPSGLGYLSERRGNACDLTRLTWFATLSIYAEGYRWLYDSSYSPRHQWRGAGVRSSYSPRHQWRGAGGEVVLLPSP